MVLAKSFILSTCAAVFLSGCSSAPQNSNTAPAINTNRASNTTPATAPTAEIATVKSGSDLYTINCMTCHKDSGKGGKVTVDGKAINPDDLTSAKMKAKTDEKLYAYIADGIEDEGMPAFKNKMSKAEIDAVIMHLRELQK